LRLVGISVFFCDLGGSGMKSTFNYIHRRGAEDAEGALRISNQQTHLESQLHRAVDFENHG
jgi:hypothetical protein